MRLTVRHLISTGPHPRRSYFLSDRLAGVLGCGEPITAPLDAVFTSPCSKVEKDNVFVVGMWLVLPCMAKP